MRRALLCQVVGILGLLALTGCGSDTRLIRGEWQLPGTEPIRMTFNDDGTYISFVTTKGIDITQSGTFSQSGSWLYLTPLKVKTNHAKLQAAYDSTRLSRSTMRTKWINDNEISLTVEESPRSKVMRRLQPSR